MTELVSLQLVTRKPRKDNLDRERLAEVAHRKRCAKHKGRNHWANWERRKMAAEKRKSDEAKAEGRMRTWRQYAEQARAYWSGLRADLPEVPHAS